MGEVGDDDPTVEIPTVHERKLTGSFHMPIQLLTPDNQHESEVEMIRHVFVEHPDKPGVRHECELGGFGTAACGRCGSMLMLGLHMGDQCAHCGAVVVEIEYAGPNNARVV